MTGRTGISVLALLAAILLAACATTPGLRPQQTLYVELGELPGITALVDEFLWQIAADERINQRFSESNIARFHDKLVEHFCALSGGPCIYSGDDMRRTHAGMGIDYAAFNALVEDLIEALDARAIGTSTQNRLLALLAPMHADIIER